LLQDLDRQFVEAKSASVAVKTAHVCSTLVTDINDLSVSSIQRKVRNVRNATQVADATTAAVLEFWPLRHLRFLRSLLAQWRIYHWATWAMPPFAKKCNQNAPFSGKNLKHFLGGGLPRPHPH